MTKEFPGGLGLWTFTAVVQFQSLIGELRSCRLHGMAKYIAVELSTGRKKDYKNIGSFCTQIVFQRSFSSWVSLKKHKPKVDYESWCSLHRKNNQNFIQQTIFKEMAFASQLKVEDWMSIWHQLT